MDLSSMTSKLQELVNKRFEPDAVWGAPYSVGLSAGERGQEVVLSVSESGVQHDRMHMPSIDAISYAFLAAAHTFPDVDFKVNPQLVSAEKAQQTMEVVL